MLVPVELTSKEEGSGRDARDRTGCDAVRPRAPRARWRTPRCCRSGESDRDDRGGRTSQTPGVTLCVSGKIGESRFLSLKVQRLRSRTRRPRTRSRAAAGVRGLLPADYRPTHARGEGTRLKGGASPSQYIPWQRFRLPCLVAPRDGRAPTPPQQPWPPCTRRRTCSQRGRSRTRRQGPTASACRAS